MNLLHDVQLYKTKADISFSAPLSTRSTIEAGELKVLDLFKMYPYENKLMTIELMGVEIDRFLEYSYSKWLREYNKDDGHVLAFQKDKEGQLVKGKYSPYRFKGLFYNFDSASGIEYTVDINKENYNKVHIKRLSTGKHFHEDSIYTVAINSYRYNGGGGHIEFALADQLEDKGNRVLEIFDMDLRFYIQEYLERNDTYKLNQSINWKIVPEQAVKEAIRRDKDLLFNELKN